MKSGNDTTVWVASLLNAGFMVRYYARGARTTTQRLERSQAIANMGMIVRESFIQSDDFEPLLIAIVDGLRPKDDPPF